MVDMKVRASKTAAASHHIPPIILEWLQKFMSVKELVVNVNIVPVIMIGNIYSGIEATHIPVSAHSEFRHVGQPHNERTERFL